MPGRCVGGATTQRNRGSAANSAYAVDSQVERGGSLDTLAIHCRLPQLLRQLEQPRVRINVRLTIRHASFLGAPGDHLPERNILTLLVAVAVQDANHVVAQPVLFGEEQKPTGMRCCDRKGSEWCANLREGQGG